MFRIAAPLLVLSACSGPVYQRLNPGGMPLQQAVSFGPLSTPTAPLSVSRASGLTASITAALPVQNISVNNGSGACVTEQSPSGFVPGPTNYTFTFTALANAVPNCTQTVTITVDGSAVTFYIIVP